MLNKKLLEHIHVLDLTQRLPGPLASNILLHLGAKVIKVEPKDKEDAFVLFAKEDALFGHWYQSLNSKKEIIKEDHTLDSLKPYLDKADLVLVSRDHPIAKAIKEKISKAIAIIEVCGSLNHNSSSMHDLNALALTKSFHLFTHNKSDKSLAPPYLPFAGIAFGQEIATEALASILHSKEINGVSYTKVYIDETAQFIYDHFWDEKLEKTQETRFLHNGKYPCYKLYRTKEGKYIALAGVESKFWLNFSQIFNLSLKEEDRFDTSNATFEKLECFFNNITLKEINHAVGDSDICLTAID